MYATRDVTATVEHMGLITASIVSKKLAAGLEHLVLDVKCGNGAVMQDRDKARALAQSMVDVGNSAGMTTSALLTDMSVPLAWSAGNAVEVKEAVAYLSDARSRHPRLDAVVMALGEKLLLQSGKFNAAVDAREALERVRDNGRALEVWAQGIEAMGGDPRVTESPESTLPRAAVVRAVKAKQSGQLSGYDVRQVGMVVVELGGGRTQPDAPIDHSVGLTAILEAGSTVQAGDDIAVLHAASEVDWERAEARFQAALEWDSDTVVPPVISAELSAT
jgi:thymidine phosphorylase